MSYTLTPVTKRLGRFVARGSRASIAKHCFEDERLRTHILAQLQKILHKEIALLCSDHTNSILKSQVAEDLVSFQWDVIYQELEKYAPTLLAVLKSCTGTTNLSVQRSNRMYLISLCAAIFCKHRRPTMSLLHKVIALILYSGHCSKQVCHLY